MSQSDQGAKVDPAPTPALTPTPTETKTSTTKATTTQGKFVATIFDGSRQVYIGLYDTAEEAAIAYNKKSIELFGVTEELNQLDADGRQRPVENGSTRASRVDRRALASIFPPKPLQL